MKKLKKLKVLIGFFSMFFLFPLTNVSAMEKKHDNYNKNMSEIKEEKQECLKEEKGNNQEQKSREAEEKKYCVKNNMPIEEGKMPIDEGKEVDFLKSTQTCKEETKDKCYKVPLFKPEKNETLLIGNKTKSSLEEKQGNNEEEEYKKKSDEAMLFLLSKNFFKKSRMLYYKDVDCDKVFKDIMKWLGYCPEKNNSDIDYPNVVINPYYFKYTNSKDGKKKLVNCNPQYEAMPYQSFEPMFEPFEPMFEPMYEYLIEYFGVDWFKLLVKYYKYCFEDSFYLPVPVFYGDKVRNVDLQKLKCYLRYFYSYKFCNEKATTLPLYRNSCRDLIAGFLDVVYLRSFFVRNFSKRYNFEDDSNNFMEDISRFSRIISNSLKLTFDSFGCLKEFKLCFDDVVKNSEEDIIFLRRLYNAMENKGGENKEDNLLYDLYIATFAFLDNVNFWTKIIGTILCHNSYNASLDEFCYTDRLDKLMTEKHVNICEKAYTSIKDYKIFPQNPQDYVVDFNYKNDLDYDFDNLNKRFKYVFSTLNQETNKGLLNYNSNNNIDYVVSVLKENCKENFNEKEGNFEELNDLDKAVKHNLYEDFFRRFGYHFGISPDFEFIKDEFEKFFISDDSVNFKLLGNDNFNVSERVMLECLDRAVQNEKIKTECLALVRHMFVIYLIEGFIKTYGNENDETNVSIVKLVEYFNNILDVHFEKCDDGKYRLKLIFKKASELEYYTKFINDIVKKFANVENWQQATEEEKVVYRLYLTAKSFIKEEGFWNKILSYLVCSNQVKTAKNIFSDTRALYEEYKKLNSEIGADNVFLKFVEGLNSDDKRYLDFISGKNYKRKEEALYFKDKDFLDKYFSLLRSKKFLRKRFNDNVKFLREMLKRDKDITIGKFGQICAPYRYCNAFFYESLEKMLEDFIISYYNYFKFGCKKKLKGSEEVYYKYILENKTIANEFTTFIEGFFVYYMSELVKNKNFLNMFFDIKNNVNDELLQSCADSIFKCVSPMLEWYSKIFHPRVEDGKIKFGFDLGYFSDKLDSSIEYFHQGFQEYFKKMDSIKHGCMNGFKYKNDFTAKIFNENQGEFKNRVIKRFLFEAYLDMFAFLNSEDFWNLFMYKVGYKTLNNFIDKKEYDEFDSNPFILDKECYDVLNRKRERTNSTLKRILQLNEK